MEAPSAPLAAGAEPRGIARAAALLAAGNLAGRALGLARELLIAHFFGASGLVSVLRLALTLPTLIYDLLFVELGSAALAPVFSAYAHPSRRAELGRVAGAVLALAAVGLAAAVLLLEALAPQVAGVLGGGYDAQLQAAATGLVRWVLPAAGLLGLAAAGMAVLHAQGRFRYLALAPVVFNGVVVAGTLLLAERLGVTSVVLGVAAGAAAHLLLQAWGLRGVPLRWSLDWRHPALRQIARLSAPVLAGLVVRGAQIALERNLASHTGAQSLAWLESALTVQRLPLALAVTALSAALLPALARHGSAGQPAAFRQTLSAGLGWALLLVLPAAGVLGVLAPEAVGLLFEHGQFTPADTAATAGALRLLLLGLPFAAIDQPLVVAFYARQNTRTPVLAGVIAVLVYAGSAPLLSAAWGLRGLALAASIQIALHALLMLAWAARRLAAVDGRRLVGAAGRTALAAAVAVGTAWLARAGLEDIALEGVWRWAALVLLPLGAAGGVYAALVWALGLARRNGP